MQPPLVVTVTFQGARVPKEGRHPHDAKVGALIRKELTVAPLSLNDPFPKKFRVYLDLPDCYVVPLHWARVALPPFGATFRDERPPARDAPQLAFEGQLRAELRQPEAVEAVLKTWQSGGGGAGNGGAGGGAGNGGAMLCLPVGFGKCLAPETPVIMYDGSVLTADDLKPGMQMMGPDSTPRNVLDVSRGTEMMYEIQPIKGRAWRCNESHILSLKYSGHGSIKDCPGQPWFVVKFYDGDFTSKSFKTRDAAVAFSKSLARDPIIDITVKNYMDLPKSVQAELKLFKAGPIDFPKIPAPDIDAYILGAWLGDGTSAGPQFTLVDAEIVNHLDTLASPSGLKLHRSLAPSVALRAPSFTLRHDDERKGRINTFMRALKEYNLVNNKHIPTDIKLGSQETRLRVLAGLLDTDGYYNRNCYEITQKNQKLADDIVFVARSLGFAVSTRTVQKTCIKPNGQRVSGMYQKISIYGEGLENIPVALARKKAVPRKQVKDARRCGFTCTPVGTGTYVGPVLDADHRYLLGDFTVTHNTTCALYLAARLRKKTLVLVHKAFLKDQWIERVGQCLPAARVTEVQGEVCDTSGDVVVAMIQTLISRKYDPARFEGFGLVVVDEVHHLGAQAFSQSMWGLCAPRVLGLSATPERKDGLVRVIGWFAGPIAFRLRRENQRSTEVRVVKYACPEFEAPPPVNRRGDVCFTTVITRLAENPRRTEGLAREAAALAAAGKHVLVLTHRRQHTKDLAAAIAARGAEVGTYVGGDKACPDTRVVVATYALTSEGFDLPRLNALVLATPASDVEQSCGRVMRGSSAAGATIVDWVDQWGVCFSQHAKRRAFYARSGFTVTGQHGAATADDQQQPRALQQYAFL